MTFVMNAAILLDIPILRETVVFIFLSLVPGFAILKLFKFENLTLLDTSIFSVALSIAFVMFDSLLVNQVFLFLGLAQPLTIVPLTLSLSVFTLIAFIITSFRHDLPKAKIKKTFKIKKNYLPLAIILPILPLLSAMSVLYYNVDTLLLSCAIIAVLCVMSAVFRSIFPEELFPILIFSISLCLVFQFILTSTHVLGYDANLEYYVFRTTQLNGHWSSLDASINSVATLNYGSMLSITLLPAVYSTLMGVQAEVIFKIFYPLIFCLVPVALFRINENQFGKIIGLMSALFFSFTFVAFFSPEPLSLNRQIIGELFLLLSVFLLVNKNLPVTKRRLLLIIFGAALVVSHYSLAYIYLAILTAAFIISKLKSGSDNALNSATLLLLFIITFTWYSITGGPFFSMIDTVQRTFTNLIGGFTPSINTASTMYAVPQVFRVTTWINLLLTGISYIFLMVGILLVVFKPKITGISSQYRILLVVASVLLVISVIVPNIAVTLNFTRVFAICLLFLSPCFVLGGQALLNTINRVLKKIKPTQKLALPLRRRNIAIAPLLIAIILGAYFLSQVGFVNRVGNGTNYYYSMYFEDMVSSNDSQYKFYFYGIYIPEHDIFSAKWLEEHKVGAGEVLADTISGSHVLLSYGLIPNKQLLPITNTTYAPQGSFIYLGSLNVVNGIVALNTNWFNTSEVYPLFNESSVVYSNCNSEIRYVDHFR